jgi:tRNA pseudouridine32 synthase/23S rRNA pseudouridine746 synthase
MATIGHPILGDPFYAEGPARAFERLMLHAESLQLRHPDGGRTFKVTSPVPF